MCTFLLARNASLHAESQIGTRRTQTISFIIILDDGVEQDTPDLHHSAIDIDKKLQKPGTANSQPVSCHFNL